MELIEREAERQIALWGLLMLTEFAGTKWIRDPHHLLPNFSRSLAPTKLRRTSLSSLSYFCLLTASKGRISQSSIGCLYLHGLAGDAKERGCGVSEATTSEWISISSRLLEPLPVPVFRSFLGKGAGKHTWLTTRASHTILSVSPPSSMAPKTRFLAMAITNTILQPPWMHFQNAEAINQ